MNFTLFIYSIKLGFLLEFFIHENSKKNSNRPNDHPIMKKWYELYTKKNSSSQQKVIPDSTFSLIKFFIASDTALEQFKSPFLKVLIFFSVFGSVSVNIPKPKLEPKNRIF